MLLGSTNNIRINPTTVRPRLECWWEVRSEGEDTGDYVRETTYAYAYAGHTWRLCWSMVTRLANMANDWLSWPLSSPHLSFNSLAKGYILSVTTTLQRQSRAIDYTKPLTRRWSHGLRTSRKQLLYARTYSTVHHYFIKDPPLCDIFYCYIQFLFLLNTQVATIMFAFASRRGSAIARTRIQSFGVGNRERGHLKTDRFVSVLKPSYTFWSSCFRRADLLLLIQTVAQVELVFSNESPHFWSGLAWLPW